MLPHPGHEWFDEFVTTIGHFLFFLRDLYRISLFPLVILFIRGWLGIGLYFAHGQFYYFSLCSSLGVFCTNATGLFFLQDIIYFLGTTDFFIIFPILYIPLALMFYRTYVKPRNPLD